MVRRMGFSRFGKESQAKWIVSISELNKQFPFLAQGKVIMPLNSTTSTFAVCKRCKKAQGERD
jgi:hypothetical protein